VLLSALFAAPLLLSYFDGSLTTLFSPSWTLLDARNLVVAPLTEELCFRAGLVSYILLHGTSPLQCVFLSPLYFAMAHMHHVYDMMKHQKRSVRQALLVCLVQGSYTMVFGWLATYLFIRSGQVTAPIAAHVFCNRMGFPKFDRMFAHPRKKVLLAVLLCGITAFALLLVPLTNPQLYGYNIGESYINALKHNQ
jgi:prenyl protein peptidase